MEQNLTTQKTEINHRRILQVIKSFGLMKGDVVFVIQELSHSRFTREGDNLNYKTTVSLSEALTGCTLDFITLDERSIKIPIHEIIR